MIVIKIVLMSSADIMNPYGSTTRPYYISKNLSKIGCEILHICNSYKFDDTDPNIKYILKKKSAGGLKFLRMFRDFLRVYKECKEFNPEVLYVHQTSNALRAIPLKYLLNIPLIFDAHGSSVYERSFNTKINKTIIKYYFLEELIFNISNKVIVLSKELEEFAIKTFHVSTKKLSLVTDGVDTNLFKPSEHIYDILKGLGISEKNKIVLFTCPRQGFPPNIISLNYFFTLIPEIENKINNVKFIITGGGPQIEPPSKNVIYTGFVSDLSSYINIADVCVVPYPPSAISGGTLNKVIEYFACGKPVVSTTEGIKGYSDAVNYKHFLLADDSKSFVDKIILILNDEKLANKLSENARELACNYDWIDKSKQVFEIIVQLNE